jgi:hypothetical protein
MDKSFTELAVIEAARLLMPLRRLDNPKNIAAFLKELGWTFGDNELIDVDLGTLVGLIDDLEAGIEVSITEDGVSADPFLNLAPNIKSTIDAVRDAEDALRQNWPELAGEFTKRVFDYLVYVYFLNYHPKIFAFLHILGILERHPTQGYRIVLWDRILLLFSQPASIPEDVYGWNTDQFNPSELLSRLEVLLHAFVLPGGLYQQSEQVRTAIGNPVGTEEIRIPLYQAGDWVEEANGGESYCEFDVNISPYQENTGLYLYPYFQGGISVDQPLWENWKAIVNGNINLNSEANIGLLLRPPHDLSTWMRTEPTEFGDLHLELGIRRVAPEDKLTVLFSDQGCLLGYKEIGLTLIIIKKGDDEELALEVDIDQLTLTIGTEQGDGFLQKILSGIKLDTVCDLTLGWSTLRGVYFAGSAALEIAIPVHTALGPINLQTIYILVTLDGGIKVGFAVTLSAVIGPISASVDKIGMMIPIELRSNNDGNLGPIQVKFPEFLPPVGAGLALDVAGIISGGGYLEIDNVNQSYAGILQLNLGGVGIVAIGLITTHMPDGSQGFSMLVIIAVEFFPAIQLSYGFTLIGIGGLIGINRTMVINVLQDGIRTGSADSILFPQDPIVNAPRIISDLKNIFPPSEGRFVVGPMIKIGWGTPTLISGELGIFIELPLPIRIVVLGQLTITLPVPELAVIELHLDVLGAIDFSAGFLSIDASLYDSRILIYELYGDAALRLNWGDNPQFALSLGGFHPRYSPPAGFPTLRRLTLSLGLGDQLKLSSQIYLALTANSLQFGSNTELYVGTSEASIEGQISFDTLIDFPTFSFRVDIYACMTIKIADQTLAGISVTLSFSGPTPWNVNGKATIELLFLSITVQFDFTWGDMASAPQMEIDPLMPFLEALERQESWGSKLPSGSNMVEMMRSLEAGDNQVDILYAHPAGTLEVRQNVLPLGVQLQKYGNSIIKDHDKFTIDSIEDGQGNPFTIHPDDFILEYFSRIQFEYLSDDQKISLPDFEKMKAGIAVSSNAIKLGGEVLECALEYESAVIDEERMSYRSDHENGTVLWSIASQLTNRNAANRISGSLNGMGRYSIPGVQANVEVAEESYVIVNVSNLRVADGDLAVDGAMTRMQADQVLAAYRGSHPEEAEEFQVVSMYEAVR